MSLHIHRPHLTHRQHRTHDERVVEAWAFLTAFLILAACVAAQLLRGTR